VGSGPGGVETGVGGVGSGAAGCPDGRRNRRAADDQDEARASRRVFTDPFFASLSRGTDGRRSGVEARVLRPAFVACLSPVAGERRSLVVDLCRRLLPDRFLASLFGFGG